MNDEIKVGDYVEITVIDEGVDSYKVGEIYRIIDIDEDGDFRINTKEENRALLYQSQCKKIPCIMDEAKTQFFSEEILERCGQIMTRSTPRMHGRSFAQSIWEEEQEQIKDITREKTKMELKNIKKDNLKEAKKQFEEEKTNEEIVFAKNEYRGAVNAIDNIDRDIKRYEEAKVPHQKIIDAFKGK